jgi:hypothetical protein
MGWINDCQINAVKSLDVDRLGTADLAAREAPDNVKHANWKLNKKGIKNEN